MQGLKSDDWFMQDYVPAVPYDEEEDIAPDTTFPIKEVGQFHFNLLIIS